MRTFVAMALICACLTRGMASTIVAWGAPDNLQTSIPGDLTNAVGIGVGAGFGVALLENGTIRKWGDPYNQVVGAVPADLTNVVAISSGDHHCLALKSDSTVVAWGSPWDDYGQANVPSGLTNVIAIAAGSYHSLALRSDGTVVGFGHPADPYPNYGEAVVPAGMSNVIAIAAGASQSLLLRADGRTVFWGVGAALQGPYATNSSDAAAVGTDYLDSLILRRGGVLEAWGSNQTGQTNLPADLTNVVAFACAGVHSMALSSNGKVTAWGSNAYGQTNVPADLDHVMAVACSWSFSAALSGQGSLRIVQQPRRVDAVAGDNSLLSCGVIGQLPIASQWFFSNSPLAGRTSQLLFLTNVTPGMAGLYYLTLSNSISSTQTVAVSLNVQPLAITVQPTNVAVYAGDPAGLAVQARNIGPFAYQWRRDGTNLPGQTDAQISWTIATTNDAGNYSVVVNNLYGSVTSSVAALNVTAVSFSTQPTNRTIYSGESTIFVAAAWKNGPFSYQWRFNGSDLPAQTNAALALAAVTTSQAGPYTVRVSSPYGSLESSNAILTVIDTAPIITGQPTNRFAWHLGGSTLRVTATGSKPLTYQWRRNGQDIPSATNSALSVTGVVSSVPMQISVLVSNPIGTTLSATAAVTVIPLAYWGTAQVPINVAPPVTNVIGLASGGYYGLALQSNGMPVAWGAAECPPFLFPGLSNIVSIAVGGSHSLALRSDGRIFAWGCNAVGPVLPNVVAVAAGYAHSLALKGDGTVVGWGSIWATPPGNLKSVVAISAGDSFSVALKSDGTLVAWGINAGGRTNIPAGLSNVVAISCGDTHTLALKRDGTLVSWGSGSYGVTNVPAGLSNIVVIGTGSAHSLAVNANGVVTAWGNNDSTQAVPPSGLSNVVSVVGGDWHSLAQITLDGVTISRQPLNTTVSQGKPALLSAAAVSPQPVVYQWRYNNADIQSATNSWLFLPSAQPADQGMYSVVMSNPLGVVTSRDALVTVTDRPPVIVIQPLSVATNSMASVSFLVAAEGSPLLKYQWRKDGVAIPASTNSTLTLTNTSRTNSGLYTVLVTNAFGSNLSEQAVLRIVTPQKLSAPLLLPDGSLQLSSSDNDGSILTTNDLPFISVWASSNLVHWESLADSITVTNGTLSIRDSTVTNHTQRFYRLTERVSVIP